jgi:hypothetical protein
MGGRYFWFWLGFMAAQTVNIVFVIGPEKASQNLHEWAALISDARPLPPS